MSVEKKRARKREKEREREREIRSTRATGGVGSPFFEKRRVKAAARRLLTKLDLLSSRFSSTSRKRKAHSLFSTALLLRARSLHARANPLARRSRAELGEGAWKRHRERERQRQGRQLKMPQQQNVTVAMLGGGPITRAAAHAAASTSQCGGAPSTSAPAAGDSTGYGGGKRRSGSGGGGEVREVN